MVANAKALLTVGLARWSLRFSMGPFPYEPHQQILRCSILYLQKSLSESELASGTTQYGPSRFFRFFQEEDC